MSENSIEFSLSNSEQRDSWLNSSHRTLDADRQRMYNIWYCQLGEREGRLLLCLCCNQQQHIWHSQFLTGKRSHPQGRGNCCKDPWCQYEILNACIICCRHCLQALQQLNWYSYQSINYIWRSFGVVWDGVMPSSGWTGIT